jgi:transposase InsO family protein
MIGFLRLVGHVLVSPFKTRTRLEAEIILLRHQLNVLRRRAPAERLIGSIRRECFDHIVIFGGAHLRRILAAYTGYYNELRTHLTLDKDSPGHRPVQPYGQLIARLILGGLHHQYCRM